MKIHDRHNRNILKFVLVCGSGFQYREKKMRLIGLQLAQLVMRKYLIYTAASAKTIESYLANTYFVLQFSVECRVSMYLSPVLYNFRGILGYFIPICHLAFAGSHGPIDDFAIVLRTP